MSDKTPPPPELENLPVFALLRFAESLPTTIRDLMIAKCCLGYDESFSPRPDDNYVELFRSRLLAGDVVDVTNATAKMIGLMELALERDQRIDLKEMGRELFEKTGSPLFNKMALGDPLKDRHWDAAYAEFYELRKGVLSPKALGLMMSEAARMSLRRYKP